MAIVLQDVLGKGERLAVLPADIAESLDEIRSILELRADDETTLRLTLDFHLWALQRKHGLVDGFTYEIAAIKRCANGEVCIRRVRMSPISKKERKGRIAHMRRRATKSEIRLIMDHHVLDLVESLGVVCPFELTIGSDGFLKASVLPECSSAIPRSVSVPLGRDEVEISIEVAEDLKGDQEHFIM